MRKSIAHRRMSIAGLASTAALVAGLVAAPVASSAPTAGDVAARQSGSWSFTTFMPVGRARHGMTRLADGTVLVIGGGTGVTARDPASPTLYDPTTHTWRDASRGLAVRDWAPGTTIALRDGGALRICAGCAAPSMIFVDADTGWVPTGEMVHPRVWLEAVLLADGRVFVVGGRAAGEGVDPGTRLPAEIYDPDTGTWSVVGEPERPRRAHSLTLLNDGRVLLAGGAEYANGAWQRQTTAARLYDPATGRSTPTGSMNQWRNGSAILLPDGTVLRTGGDFWAPRTAETYDPATGTWTLTGTPRVGTFAPKALLGDGTVLQAEGFYSQIYDPPTRSWHPAATPQTMGRSDSSLVSLADGTALLTGGFDDYGSTAPDAWVYTP